MDFDCYKLMGEETGYYFTVGLHFKEVADLEMASSSWAREGAALGVRPGSGCDGALWIAPVHGWGSQGGICSVCVSGKIERWIG